jgi:hypothetical protein
MTKSERQLRFVQFACILFLATCILLVYVGALGNPQPSSTIGLTQGILILLSLWSAISGFTVQRRLQHRHHGTSTKSTPFTRWRAGHLFRLWSAMAVGLWGLALYELRGPLWMDDALFGLGIVLLLIWRPGASPGTDNPVVAQSGR